MLQSLPHFPKALGGTAVIRDGAAATLEQQRSSTVSTTSAPSIGGAGAPRPQSGGGPPAAPVLEALHHGSPVFSVAVELRTGQLRFTVLEDISSSTLMDYGQHLLQVSP